MLHPMRMAVLMLTNGKYTTTGPIIIIKHFKFKTINIDIIDTKHKPVGTRDVCMYIHKQSKLVHLCFPNILTIYFRRKQY